MSFYAEDAALAEKRKQVAELEAKLSETTAAFAAVDSPEVQDIVKKIDIWEQQWDKDGGLFPEEVEELRRLERSPQLYPFWRCCMAKKRALARYSEAVKELNALVKNCVPEEGELRSSFNLISAIIKSQPELPNYSCADTFPSSAVMESETSSSSQSGSTRSSSPVPEVAVETRDATDTSQTEFNLGLPSSDVCDMSLSEMSPVPDAPLAEKRKTVAELEAKLSESAAALVAANTQEVQDMSKRKKILMDKYRNGSTSPEETKELLELIKHPALSSFRRCYFAKQRALRDYTRAAKNLEFVEKNFKCEGKFYFLLI